MAPPLRLFYPLVRYVAPPLRCFYPLVLYLALPLALSSGHVTLQVITLSGAIGLQSNSACLLGHLYLAHVSSSSSPTAGESSHQTVLLRLYAFRQL